MELLLPRIWVFVLAFGLGISISAIWRIYTLPADIPAPSKEPVVAESVMEMPDTSDGEPRIRGELHSCGASADGQGYEYTDGGWVAVQCRRFKSSRAATRELEKRKHNATFAEQLIQIDTRDNSVTQEFLLTSPNIVRLRKTGRLLCEVKASSLKHLRLFEKQGIPHPQ